MIQHTVTPTPESWASGEAQKYGWEHFENSSGVYGAFAHMFVADKVLPTSNTRAYVAEMKQLIDAAGCVLATDKGTSRMFPAADVIIANAMKEDGQISTDREAFAVNLQVGLYILKTEVEIPQVLAELA